MLKELGRFKNLINPLLYKSEKIRSALLGNDYADKFESEDAIIKALKEQIKSHIYIDDVVEEMKPFIFYDVVVPYTSSSMKDVQLVVYIMTHRLNLDDYSYRGYQGNRVDIIAQMVEELITDPDICREFGVGKISLETVQIFERQKYYYGRILNFKVPNFTGAGLSNSRI